MTRWLPSISRRRSLGSFAISILIALCVFTYIRSKTDKKHPINWKEDALTYLDEIVEDNISRLVPQGNKFSEHINDLQRHLTCVNNTPSKCILNHTCTTRLAPVNLDLCTQLVSKRLLLLGSTSTFKLHNRILSYASREAPNTATPHSCIGPEFCTFHHICLPSSYVPSIKSERKIKPPSPRDLLNTRSALVHYIQSSSLVPHTNKDHADYAEPIIDKESGVRVKETYWAGPARRADVILLSRPPVPAPSWTYDGSRMGNWTFIDSFPTVPGTPSNRHPFGKSGNIKLELDIVMAAAKITIEKYLPEVTHTLHALRLEIGNRSKTVIWHGSPSHSTKHCNIFTYLADTFSEDQPASDEDLWTLYYEVQRYIQDRILAALLPHWNVVFLPLDINGAYQDGDKTGTDTSVVEDEDGISRRFLENLALILHRMET
ncbi:hypothetical protein HWV62_37723 [Athelia sp. TMB]|nr:hypothetical protein HWV62_20952 [Athelia sp. TMB]KAF7980562.1 hypothetical protein HWV62_37723 [Athelia sp. TMB]